VDPVSPGAASEEIAPLTAANYVRPWSSQQGVVACAARDVVRASTPGELPLSSVDDRLLERIKDAEAPFWRHVRDALALVSADD
jgi:hypothetical protein